MTTMPIIAVVSPKGGNGKTTVSANLAVALARYSEPLVIDLDVHFGDIEYAFRLDPAHRLDDIVLRSGGGSDRDLLRFLDSHPTGVAALCAPNDPVVADRLNPDDVMQVVDVLIGLQQPLVLDTAGGISDYTLGALDRATAIVLVSGTDVPSVQAARKLLDTMQRLHIDQGMINLVVNRSNARCGLRVEDVESALDLSASLAVPEHQSLAASMNQGCPVTESDPGCSIATGFDRLAVRLLGIRPTGDGHLRRLLRGRR